MVIQVEPYFSFSYFLFVEKMKLLIHYQIIISILVTYGGCMTECGAVMVLNKTIVYLLLTG